MEKTWLRTSLDPCAVVSRLCALQVRHNEDKLNAELARCVRWEVDNLSFDSPHTKVSVGVLRIGVLEYYYARSR